MSDNLLSCEKDRAKKGCGRDRMDWRRAEVEAPKMERRDGIFGRKGFAGPVVVVSGLRLEFLRIPLCVEVEWLVFRNWSHD